jgi:hypothetical protein
MPFPETQQRSGAPCKNPMHLVIMVSTMVALVVFVISASLVTNASSNRVVLPLQQTLDIEESAANSGRLDCGGLRRALADSPA